MEGLEIMLICTLLLVKGNAQQSFDVEAYLNQKEAEVKQIAAQASKNDSNVCDLLKTCVGTNCSRSACSSLSSGECLEVPANSACSAPNGTCQQMRLSLEESDVRLPPGTSMDQVLTKSICSQRLLDLAFQQIWNNRTEGTKLSLWLFFGSATGVQRSYPGKGYTTSSCSGYDPRKRPWYIGATAVIKHLHILLDVSSYMSKPDPLSLQPAIDLARNVTMELIDTLALHDYVQVSTYNEKGVSLVQSLVIESNETIPMLRQYVTKIQINSTYEHLVDNAFLWTIQNFKNATTTRELKIVIVFTSQSPIANLNDTAIESVTNDLLSQDIKAFIYRFGANTTNDSDLQQFVSSVNSSFEILGGSSNALWRLRSYFDYIAFLRLRSVEQTPLWTSAYTDYNGMGRVITVTFPAFDSNNRLIGVAGIDTLVDQIKGMENSDSAVLKRNGLEPTSTTGDLQYKSQVGANACPSSNPTPLCRSSTTSSSACCGYCTALGTQPKKSSTNKIKIIIIACGIGAPLLIIISSIVVWQIMKYKNRVVDSGTESSQWETMQ